MGAGSRIDLLIPGLFGPIPVRAAEVPGHAPLSWFLGKAQHRAARGSDPLTALFDRFGVALVPDRDPPSAPFSRLAQVPDSAGGGYWLHADPVHLRPDRDRLLLFDARHLRLTPQEADSLVGLFNRHFAAEGLRLENPTPERWFLQVDAAPRLRTTALADAIGRGVERSYLHGEDAARWMRWLNEAQMLFHDAGVNRDRESAGRPTVSGIWPWGGGSLPAAVPGCGYGAVFASHPLAVGLARAAGVAPQAVPGSAGEMLAAGPAGRMLLFWDLLWTSVLDGDPETWVRELSRFADWLGGLRGLLRAGDVRELAIYPCDGTCLLVTRHAFRRFWRRPAGIASRLRGVRAD